MNEQTIFLAALDVADPGRRADYLARACGGDAALRRRVDALLAAHGRSSEFLAVPALEQLAPGGRASPDETSAGDAAGGEVDLSFLGPPAGPGSLGRLGHYDVREVLGRGGCGIVLKAVDEVLRRPVAVKVMAPELAATSPARKRFLREARAAAAVRHDNVVSIHAVEDKPVPFLVMEYVAGQTLQERIDGTGPLDPPEVARVGGQIASGLAAAHATGLIHRDIKPGNVLIEAGTDRVKLTDFGLARTPDDASVTQSGVIAGTPLFMSPEQAQGLAVDARSDLFSLGGVLYAMCTGRPPFRAATTLAVLRRVVEDDPRPVREVIPEVPAWLAALIAALHAKDPAGRPASAREVADILAAGRFEPRPAPAPAEPPKAPEAVAVGRPPRRRRGVAAAALIGVLLAGLGAAEAAGVTRVGGTVVRLFSPAGTLVVEVDDPGVSVSVDGQDLTITGAGAKEIRLKPGQYTVLATKDGKPVRQELVTVSRGGREVVRVGLEPDPQPNPPPPEPPKPPAVATTPPGIDPLPPPDPAADPDREAAEYVLSVGGQVRINDERKDISRPAHLPAERFAVTQVSLTGSRATDDGLARLARCKNLKVLGLFNTAISTKGLAHLNGCTTLEDVNLNMSRATGAALRYFAQSKGIRLLGLWMVDVRDADLAVLSLANVENLNLGGTRITDAALGPLKESNKLATLTLSYTAVTAEGLARLAACPSLRSLGLNGCGKLDDGSVPALAKLTGLKNLELKDTKVTFAGVDALAKALPGCRITWNGGVSEPTAKPNPPPGPAADTDREAAEYVLSVGGRVRVDDGEKYITRAADLPAGRFTLTRINLSVNGRVTDDGLAPLAGCKNVKWLGLHGTAVGNKGLAHLDGCTTLEEVILAHSKASGAALRYFARSKGIRRLSLWSLDVRDADLAALDLGNVEELNVGATRITDAALGPLAKEAKKLQVLNLRYTGVTAEGLARLAGCPALRALEVVGCGKVDDGCVPALAKLTALERLYVDQTKVTAAGVDALAKALPGCRIAWNGGVVEPTAKPNPPPAADADTDRAAAEYVLSVGGRVRVDGGEKEYAKAADLPAERFTLVGIELGHNQRLTGDGLAPLARCKNVKWLWMHGAAVDDKGLAHLDGCTTLETVEINSTKASGAALVYFSRSKGLKKLGVWSLDVGDADLAALDLGNVEDLNIGGNPITDATLGPLAKDAKKLRVLTLNYTGVTAKGLADLAGCPALRVLGVAGCGNVDDGCVPALAKLTGLERLHVDQTKVTAAGVDALKKALPGCKIVWNGGAVEPTAKPLPPPGPAADPDR